MPAGHIVTLINTIFSLGFSKTILPPTWTFQAVKLIEILKNQSEPSGNKS